MIGKPPEPWANFYGNKNLVALEKRKKPNGLSAARAGVDSPASFELALKFMEERTRSRLSGSPRRRLHTRRARVAASQDFAFDSASPISAEFGDRTSADRWKGLGKLDQLSGAEIRDRVRKLKQSDPVMVGMLRVLSANVPGIGLKLQSAIEDRVVEELGYDSKRTRLLKEKIERRFNKVWAEREADFFRKQSFFDMTVQAFECMATDGDVLANVVYDDSPGRSYGLAIEMIKADRLATPLSKDVKGKRIKDGVELDANGRAVAYYIRDDVDSDYGVDVGFRKFRRVPARDEKTGRQKIIHLFQQEDPGQVRGRSLFAPVLDFFADVADVVDSEVTATYVSSCITAFLTRQDPAEYLQALADIHGTSQHENELPYDELTPGTIMHGNPNEKMELFNPDRPGSNFDTFLARMMRLIGQAIGIPYEMLDFKSTTYSSARAAILEARKFFTKLQTFVIRHFCQPIFELWLEEAFLRGELDIDDFYQERSIWTESRWASLVGWGWVEPKKEVEAALMRGRSPISTWTDEAAAQGKDFDEIIERKKYELERLAEVGITPESLAALGGGSSSPPTGKDEPDNEESSAA